MTSAIIVHHRDVLTLAVSRDNSLAHPARRGALTAWAKYVILIVVISRRIAECPAFIDNMAILVAIIAVIAAQAGCRGY